MSNTAAVIASMVVALSLIAISHLAPCPTEPFWIGFRIGLGGCR